MGRPEAPKEALVSARLELDKAERALRRTATEARGHGPERGRSPLLPRDAEDRAHRLAERREHAMLARRALDELRRDALAADAGRDATLLSTEYPMVLFPLRIETRFQLRTAAAGPALLIRVYPDAIVADGHDELLSASELAAAQAFWRAAWRDEGAAWRELLARLGPTRAAWVARSTQPSNVGDRPAGEPLLPPVELEADEWNRPPRARLAPDRWLALAFRDGREVRRAASGLVAEPLLLGIDPHAPGDGRVHLSEGLSVDPALAWLFDFAAAEAAGMAVRMPLDEDELRRGFDRLLVIGTKPSLPPEQAAIELGALLDAHHYASGLALVPQGTATNNTENGASGYPTPDPAGARSFAVERGPSLVDDPASDGVLLARALGLSPAVMAHVAGADRFEQRSAAAMNEALWPVCLGYQLAHFVAPEVAETTIDEARRHFVEHVRGRGPLPALRVGALPWGVLPVSSLTLWAPRPEDSATARYLASLLRRLRPLWLEATERVPRIGTGSDPDGDLLGVLTLDASSKEVWVRRAYGPDLQRNLLSFVGADERGWAEAGRAVGAPLRELVGASAWPRLLELSYDPEAYRFRHELVARRPLSETMGLGFDYIAWIRSASLADLRTESMPAGQDGPRALLYRMLRHARLAVVDRLAVELRIAHGIGDADERHEIELVGIVDGTSARLTPWQRLEQPIPELTGELPVGEFLLGHRSAPELGELRRHDLALAALEGVPTAELGRLFGETLDLSSHRFDAWATSLASQRLEAMRRARPTGAHIGAYGFVEDLHPRAAAAEVTLSDGRRAAVPPSAGYVHAPSPDHAVAAAVLRNAHVGRPADQRDAWAVDLSSARVRATVELLDAVRDGVTLGAALGARFERGLAEGPASLSRFVEPLRRRFPLGATGAGAGGPSSAAAARIVVDGLALRAAWREGSLRLDAIEPAVPAPSDTERGHLERELGRLEELVDGVADLLTAEGVFQLVRGNAAAARAALDAMAGRAPPPHPEVVQAPHQGVVVLHRVAMLFDADPSPAPGWPAQRTPRARAEPRLDRWLGLLFGDPSGIRCRVRPTASDGLPEPAGVVVTAADLRLCPLDLFALARRGPTGTFPSAELDLRVVEVGLASTPTGTTVDVSYGRDPSWEAAARSLSDIFELAAAIDRVLSAARPLEPADLMRPRDAASSPRPGFAAESLERATTARAQLTAIATELARTLEDLEAFPGDTAVLGARLGVALRQASLFGLAGAFPRADPGAADELAAQARTVAAAAAARAEAAAGETDPAAIVRHVFGESLPLLTPFASPNHEELTEALAHAASLVGDTGAPWRWIVGGARVRPGLAAWRRLRLCSEALGAPRPALQVIQLPHRPAGRWAALPLGPGELLAPDSVSVVFDAGTPPRADAPWVGLRIDEWPEVVPASEQTTGVALHHQGPGCEAPQAILLAVPPSGEATWDLASVTAILHETLDLARVRGVDGDLLGALGQLRPAIYLAANAADDTISTDFDRALTAASAPATEE